MTAANGNSAEAKGASLAALHRAHGHAGPSLHAYEEQPRAGGWSLRSALVRYAQPEPVRSGKLLELVRRSAGALAPHIKAVEADARLSDLARAMHAWSGRGDELIESYVGAGGRLDPEERPVLATLTVAAALDELGAELAAWAIAAGPDRPNEAVDACCTRVAARLAELGVEPERPQR